MQPPSRVVHNSSMCSLTLTQLSVLMQPNNPETTPLVLQHVQVVLLARLVVSLLSSVQPNQANKRVNFQLAISSYLPISGHQGQIGAHDLQQCCFTSPLLMACRKICANACHPKSEWSKNDVNYNFTSIFDIS